MEVIIVCTVHHWEKGKFEVPSIYWKSDPSFVLDQHAETQIHLVSCDHCAGSLFAERFSFSNIFVCAEVRRVLCFVHSLPLIFPRVCGSLDLSVFCPSTMLLCLLRFYSPWHQFGRITICSIYIVCACIHSVCIYSVYIHTLYSVSIVMYILLFIY